MKVKEIPTARASKRLHVEFPTAADAQYALSIGGSDAFEAPYFTMFLSRHESAANIVVISEGNRREAETVADKIRGLRAPAPAPSDDDTVVPFRRPGSADARQDELATARQREYLASLADQDPSAASDFGIGPLAGGIPANLTKREASRLISELR